MKIPRLLKSLFFIVGTLFALAIAPIARAQTVDVSFADTTGFGQSSLIIMINNIKVNTTITNPFDPSHPTVTTTAYNVPFSFDIASLHLIPTTSSATNTTTSACASLSVTVTDAYTGSAISGATVLIGSGTQTTSSSGVASFTGLVSGANSITASAANYTSASSQATLSCTSTNTLGISLNPTSGTGAISGNQARVVLAWGSNPRDLDSHLTGPTSATTSGITSTSRFHVYYGNKNSSRTGTELASLDRDVTTGLGPETVTVFPPSGSSTLRAGVYRYSVHHYSGSSSIPDSNATVNLTVGSTTRQFTPPSSSTTLSAGSTIWTVFDMVVDSTGSVTIYPVNTYSTSGSTSTTSSTTLYENGTTTTTGYGDIERDVDFARLPAK